MDSIKIYSASGALLIDVVLEDTSAQDWGIMSENQVALEFYIDECVILPASCYIEFDGQRFWLLEEYKPTENDSEEWAYQVRFLGAESLLAVTVVLNTTDNLDEPIFNLTAPASQHLDFIVKNLNRRFPGMNWRVGVVPETENIHIEYVGTYASDALQTIVGEKYEWWVDDYVVNVGRCEFGTTIELGYGKGLIGGITYSTANEMRSYAYLYPIGSTRNIDPAKYGHARLQLPNGQTRIDINPEQGLSELVEADAFASIFPRYVGKVTSVRTSTGENSDGTTFLIYHIKDTAIPFNPNDYEIAGEVKHITFQSGELMGADFEVNYDANNKEFEIITQFLDEGLSQLPGGTLIPKTGDKYVVWNISMPDEYYPLAEQEFLQAALSFVQDSIKETSVYRASVDFIDLQERGLTLRPGQKVRLLSDEYFPQNGYYDSRITRIIRDICYPDELIIEVSTVVTQGTISRLRTSVSDSATKVASLGQSLKNYVDVMSPQSVRGVKNFVSGLSIGGVGLWRHPDGYVYLDETLVLKGGVVMYGDSSGVNVPPIFDSLPIDGRTIKRDGNGALYVDETALSVSGGGGVADSVYWNNVIGKPSWIGLIKPTYKYSEIEESPDLSVYALKTSIPTKLSQLTDDVVSGKYLSLTGGTVDGSITATLFVGNLTGNVTGNVSGSSGSCTGNAASAATVRINNAASNVLCPLIFVSNTTAGNKDLFVSTGKSLTFNPSTGGLTAKNFIGTLTGNADSATKLATARTIWGQTFDGTGNIDGEIRSTNTSNDAGLKAYGAVGSIFFGVGSSGTNRGIYDLTNNHWMLMRDASTNIYFPNGNIAIGSTTADAKLHVHGTAKFTDNISAPSVNIDGISLRKVDNYLYLDSSLVLSGGVTMYGDDGTTVKPIWESIPFDRATIDWVDGMWTVVGGVGSGGISEEFLNVKLQEYQPLLSTTNKLPYSLISGTPDLNVYFLASNFTKANIKSTLGISDWALASAKPTYTASEVGALGVNNTAQSALKMTPEYLTDLNSATPWRFFDMKTGYGSADGNKPNVAWVSGITGTVASSSNYRWQLAATTGNNRPYFRQESKGDWSNWNTLAFTSDIPTKLSQLTDDVVTGKYLPLTGGTINGSLTATTFVGILNGQATAASLLRRGTSSTAWCVANGNALDIYNAHSTKRFWFGYSLPEGSPYATNEWHFGASDGTGKDSGKVYASSFIGNLTGNADSATKLATARTIWGQSFDGTGNISGDIKSDNIIPTASGSYTLGTADNQWYAIYSIRLHSKAGSDLYIGASNNNNIVIKKGGNVAVGGITANATLHVHGDAIIQTLHFTTNEINGVNGTGNAHINYSSTGKVTIANGGGNVAIGGTDAEAKLHVHGTAKFTGDTTFSSKVVIGTIPVEESVDGTLYVDANVVFRGGVAMYGATTTTINEE